MGSSLSLLAAFSIWMGVLPGVTPRMKVFVLPDHQMIITIQAQHEEATFWHLNGEVIKVYRFNGNPIHFCEADDQILVTLTTKKNDYKAVALDGSLSRLRELPQRSIYSPVKLRGEWYAVDFATIWSESRKYPKMLHKIHDDALFSEKSFSFFKLPEVLRMEKFAYHSIWVFPWESGYIGLVQGSSQLYCLNSKYLVREKLESDRVAIPKECQVPLAIPGGWVNDAAFQQGNSDITSSDELMVKLAEWYRKKTLVHLAWESSYGVTFAYGDQLTAKLAYLTPLMAVKVIGDVQGDIKAGKDDFYWTVKVAKGVVSIEKFQLPQ